MTAPRETLKPPEPPDLSLVCSFSHGFPVIFTWIYLFFFFCLLSLLLLSPQNSLTPVSYSSNFYTPPPLKTVFVLIQTVRTRLFLGVFICAVCQFRPSSSSSVGAPSPRFAPPPHRQNPSPFPPTSSWSELCIVVSVCPAAMMLTSGGSVFPPRSFPVAPPQQRPTRIFDFNGFNLESVCFFPHS